MVCSQVCLCAQDVRVCGCGYVWVCVTVWVCLCGVCEGVSLHSVGVHLACVSVREYICVV